MKSFMRVWLGIGVIAIGLGIGLLIVAFASGARWENAWEEQAEFTTLNQSYEGVEKLDMDIGYGEVNIINGDKFSISADNILDGELESYVENGIWYIRENEHSYSHVFGIDLPVRRIFSWDDNFTPKITVTLPDDFVAENAAIEVGAGTLKADELNAVEGEFKVDAGEMNIEKLSVSERSEYTVGTGEMTLQDTDVNDITVDCGVGYIQIDGSVNGDNNIKCGIGSVELSLNGDNYDYNYNVTCGIGDVNIDGRNYNNISGKFISNDDADSDLNLDCGIGHISVDFH